MVGLGLPKEATALQLYRIDARENLIACEPVLFTRGWAAVDTVLRRARVSGRVEVGGQIINHLADVLDKNGNMVETVALDANSYRMLKTKWMRCKVQRTTD